MIRALRQLVGPVLCAVLFCTTFTLDRAQLHPWYSGAFRVARVTWVDHSAPQCDPVSRQLGCVFSAAPVGTHTQSQTVRGHGGVPASDLHLDIPHGSEFGQQWVGDEHSHFNQQSAMESYKPILLARSSFLECNIPQPPRTFSALSIA